MKHSVLTGVLKGLLGPALVLALLTIFRHIVSALYWDRNASRLVGAFCLRYGIALYPSLKTGAVQSMNYPPIAAAAFLPATFVSTPTAALLIGETLTVLYYFIPAFLLFGTERKTAGRPFLLASCLAFVFLTLHTPPLAYSALRLHADAPALGFAALGLLFFHPDQPLSLSSILLSTFCMVLSLWTKQTMIAALLVIPVWISWVYGRKSGLRYGFWLLMWLLVFSGFFLTWLHPTDLWFNLFYLARKPWAGSFFSIAQNQLRGWAYYSASFLLLFFLFPPGRKSKATLCLWIAGAMLPIAVLNRAKMGGDVNAFSLTLYFFAIGSFLACLQSHNARRATGTLCFILGLMIVIQTPFWFQCNLSDFVTLIQKNPQQGAYDYIREHPGTVYFPWNPLSHLLAEKKLYHFEPALEDWAITGHPISQEHYEAFIPKDLRQIAFYKRNEFTHEMTWHYLPEFTQRIEVPDLPDWIVFERPSPSSSRASLAH